MTRDTIGLTDFLEAERSLSALAIAAASVAPSEALVRLAAAVDTVYLDGRRLSALSREAAVTEALSRSLRLPASADFPGAFAAAEAHCRSGADLWVVGGQFRDEPVLRALLASLQSVRSSVGLAPAAGRVMIAIEHWVWPRSPGLLQYFDRCLALPEPAPVPPPSLPVAFAPAAVDRVHHWAGTCRDLADELFRLAAVVAYRRQAPSVEVGHVEEGAEALLARHAWLVHASRTALDLPADLLDLILRCHPGEVLAATGQLRPATLDQLVAAGLLRCAGPRGWAWPSQFHYTAAKRARASARGDQYVRFHFGDRTETRLYSEVQPLIRSGRADLAVDAVRKTVRTGEKVCRSLCGDRRCFHLLDFLIQRALDGFAVITYEEIIEAVYADIDGADRTNIHPAICKLRKALGRDLWTGLVENVQGVGYRVRPAAISLLYVRPLESTQVNMEEPTYLGE